MSDSDVSSVYMTSYGEFFSPCIIISLRSVQSHFFFILFEYELWVFFFLTLTFFFDLILVLDENDESAKIKFWAYGTRTNFFSFILCSYEVGDGGDTNQRRSSQRKFILCIRL